MQLDAYPAVRAIAWRSVRALLAARAPEVTAFTATVGQGGPEKNKFPQGDTAKMFRTSSGGEFNKPEISRKICVAVGSCGQEVMPTSLQIAFREL